MDSEKLNAILADGQLRDPKDVVVGDIVQDLWTTYVEEVRGLLGRLEVAAMQLESGEAIEDNKAEIRRVLHSIKGDSGMCGITDVHQICHDTESALDDLFAKGAAADALLKLKDWVEEVIQHICNVDITSEKDREEEEVKSKPKLKALIVDDDILCRERLKMLLEDFFDCTFACNGKEGFLVYTRSLEDQNAFRLITLDINMPEMDGHETLKAIREYEQDHGIGGLDGAKVVMTTSESSSNHVFSAFKQGCEAYVVKAKMGAKLLDEIAKLGLLKVVKVKKDYALD
jgi:two-component system chemotaxis response regulator CheY